MAVAAEPAETRSRMNIVICGHVDHGKSTIAGRLLADTGSLPLGKLEQVRATCERNAKPFEYAFLLDALEDEQSQGITIDSARVFFKTAARDYVIIDAPGHIEFLRNMVTGASRAEAALLVIDAREGVRENSRRHGYLLSMLGIRQVAVLVNKMDLVGHARAVFEAIVREYEGFLDQVGIRPAHWIPVSGLAGENIARRAPSMPWYEGPIVLDALDAFQGGEPPINKPFRMPVQDVYKFAKHGDDRRIIAGTVETGVLRVGDEVAFYPSGKKSRVRSIEAFHRPPETEVCAGRATGFTLEEQIYVTRGEVATIASQPRPKVTTRLRASVFWLGREPLVEKKEYLLKLGTARVPMRVEAFHRVIDASDLRANESKGRADRNDVAECTLQLSRAIAFDLAHEIAPLGRFVIVDDYEIRGGGIVREALPDRQAAIRDRVLVRNLKWEPSMISAERRAEKYNQKPVLLLVTGGRPEARKKLAKDLEARLFEDGKIVYFLGMGNIVHGVDADIERTRENREEHVRRLAEVANILLDAGVILLVTAADLGEKDREVFKTAVGPDRVEVVWVGDHVTTDIAYDVLVPDAESENEAVDRLKRMLQEKGIIFRPW
jgi:bifunctional enzyme CysN/CysC